MADCDIFVSAERSRGDLAAWFEHDGDTGYFYLYQQPADDADGKILSHIWVMNANPGLAERDLEVRWDRSERRVGLFIKGQLWAVFDDLGARHGGGYRAEDEAGIPEDIVEAFTPLAN